MTSSAAHLLRCGADGCRWDYHDYQALPALFNGFLENFSPEYLMLRVEDFFWFSLFSVEEVGCMWDLAGEKIRDLCAQVETGMPACRSSPISRKVLIPFIRTQYSSWCCTFILHCPLLPSSFRVRNSRTPAFLPRNSFLPAGSIVYVYTHMSCVYSLL